ncbi:SURF1 family protein [Allosaccharopolyspora coralli]|uniref:SURF1-like protein n=1 Tax=Allosaccharopolyspora coralli TaxID=2665642 RepID=A0A5Q3QCU2_9PSEU|nr:SURF1 family cytochrome oxidase biogenesis protein [Allosaccharopolyspora coralli]QGK69359.1 SURF1 family protein [Allosaccharopolyspora coralli]
MRVKFLLRPGWVASIVLAVLFAVVCFTLLAPWQFNRSDQAQARNDAISESFDAEPRPLNEVLPGGQVPDESTEWAKVTLRGEYLPQAETLAWQRTVLGESAFEVLTPFRLQGGDVVLVNRGFVRPVQATRAPDFAAAPEGPVTLEARVRADETDREQRPTFTHDGRRWTHAVNAETVGQGAGLDIRPGYVTLAGAQPGVLQPMPLPRLESGPYFSYALQWIAFGTMAVLTIGYLAYSEATGRGLNSQEPRRRKVSVAEAVAEEERRERESL